MQKPSRRLMVLVAVGAVVLLGTLGYLRYFATFRFWLPPPIGIGPAGPPVPRDPFAQPWTDRPVVLLGIGDSVTKGFGATPGHSYFNLLTANPEDETEALRGVALSEVLPKLSAVNVSMSGSDSMRHASVQVAELKPFDSDTFGVVVMTTGGNDIIHWYGRTKPQECAMYGATSAQAKPWIEKFQARLSGMLDRITACFPGGCEIYLATIYDPSDGVGDAAAAGLPPWPDMLEIHGAYNDVIRSVAQIGRMFMSSICTRRFLDTVCIVYSGGVGITGGMTRTTGTSPIWKIRTIGATTPSGVCSSSRLRRLCPRDFGSNQNAHGIS